MLEDARKSSWRIDRILAIAFPVVAMFMLVYQFAYTQTILQDPIAHRVTHLGLALFVVFLGLLVENRQRWALKWSLFIISVVVIGYFMYFLEEIQWVRSVSPNMADLIMGGLTILLVTAGTYLAFGKTFPIVGAIILAYVILGRYLPFPFTVAAVSLDMLDVWLSQPGIEEGVFGDILGISANYLFLFMVFGSLLQAFGGMRFVRAVAYWAGEKLRSGPAAVAVVASSLLGTITGSTAANITITGSFTIPMMKRAGYKPEQAGAIEALASNGGQIMPPIMGATAFVMAGYSGIPYIRVIGAALLPALIYYFAVFFYVEVTARKMVITQTREPTNVKQLLLDCPLFFVPIGVLVFLLLKGFTLPYVGFWSMTTLIIVGLLRSIPKDSRLNFREVLGTVTGGVRSAGEVGIICALIGVVATCIKVSGLGVKLPVLIQDISGGHLIIVLLLGMASSILLGMGVPTVAAYIMVAIGVVPALQAMGVPLLAAHLYVFIFAIFSHLTPPVAIGALIASRLANADYWATTKEALKAAFTAFLLPFFIIYAPVIILQPEGGAVISTALMAAMILGIVSLQMGISNYCFGALKQYERVAFIISALLMITFVFWKWYPLISVGMALFVVLVLARYLERKKQSSTVLD
jgi:TRAP transporter 4TM/12TM fusion protein